MSLIYTIGHSNHSLEFFLNLLKLEEIAVIADVRSSPYSRICPQYSQKSLMDSLKSKGIKYVYLGKELGGRSEEPDCLFQGQVDYEALARRPEFADGLNRVKEGIKKYRTALLCSEKDPLQCHRAILVARKLHETGIDVRHILANGKPETHPEMEQRMLRQTNMLNGNLFCSSDENLKEAYRLHARKIAWHSPQYGIKKPAFAVSEIP